MLVVITLSLFIYPTQFNKHLLSIFYMLGAILDCMGYSNKPPQTGWLKQQTFILRVLEAGKSKIKVPANRLLVRALLLTYRWLPAYCVLHSRDEHELTFWCLFSWGHQYYWVRTPLLRPHFSLITSLKVPSPKYSHIAREGFNIWTSGNTIQCIAGAMR